jgi:uncharacterized phage-associated protein
MPLTFSFRKTTQGLNYFARQAGGRINKMKALKLLYFADRYHLRKFGRPVTNDEYFAMNFGPVASGGKDLAEGSDFRPNVEKAYAGQFLDPVNRYEVASLNDVEEKVFSESDREAMAFAWEMFGARNEFELADLTHVYPEWKRHEPALQGGVNSRVKMSYEDFLQDPPQGFDPCHPLGDEERDLRREELRELKAIHNLWN